MIDNQNPDLNAYIKNLTDMLSLKEIDEMCDQQSTKHISNSYAPVSIFRKQELNNFLKICEENHWWNAYEVKTV